MVTVNDTRLKSQKQIDAIFKGKGVKYEQELYDFIQKNYMNTKNWDYLNFRRDYKFFLMTIIENSKYKSFTTLLQKHNLIELLYMKPWQLVPELYNDFIIQETIGQELRRGQYQCNKCIKNKEYPWNTKSHELQTRSSDEPMTIYVTCLTCHAKWKTC